VKGMLMNAVASIAMTDKLLQIIFSLRCGPGDFARNVNPFAAGSNRKNKMISDSTDLLQFTFTSWVTANQYSGR